VTRSTGKGTGPDWFLSLSGWPELAAGFDVAFYELTETMTLDGVTRRGAGALAGEAHVGRSPLCPRDLVDSLASAGIGRRDRPCYGRRSGGTC
jgi:hypothetical protein